MTEFVERPRFSCALGGALETIGSLPGAVAVIHAASGCGGNLFSGTQAGGYYGSGYCGGLATPSSNVTEREIIFGGEDRLVEQLETTLEVIDAQLIVVVTGCMTEIVGDDPHSAISRVASEIPILCVNTAGFSGNSYKGYDFVLTALFREYVEKTEMKNSKTVNIFGIVPAHDPFFRGDLAEMKRLLGKLGLKANTFFGFGETLDQLKKAGEAMLNIVFSDVHGIDAAKVFAEEHHTPYITTPLPVGAAATEEFLLAIAARLGISEKKARQVVNEEKGQFYWYVERAADGYLDGELQNYAIVVADANYAYPFTRFLADDIGWIPQLTVITDDLSSEQKELTAAPFAKDFEFTPAPRLAFETDTSQIQRNYSDGAALYTDDRYLAVPTPLFVLGSSQDAEWAARLNAKILSVSYPVIDRMVMSRHYAGFTGGLNLFEDILATMLRG
ncbi:MAG: hypothetical protein LBT32_04470 [Peptococcaceae bacterium]|jgi:nitrogenase molybdenum-iron protein beta chain|nr:hypothetical protein [Peptococcaceae bacterium]